jgi:hypothetical protein
MVFPAAVACQELEIESGWQPAGVGSADLPPINVTPPDGGFQTIWPRLPVACSLENRLARKESNVAARVVIRANHDILGPRGKK